MKMGVEHSQGNENMNLNEQQQIAVNHYGTPQVIIAGAGTGKTTVMIAKIGALIAQHHYTPASIVALTFTNKAANEMRTRYLAAGLSEGGVPTFGTFHSFCLRFLKQSQRLQDIGYPGHFSLMDPSQQRDVVAKLIKNTGKPDQRARDVLSRISSIKQSPRSDHAALLADRDDEFSALFRAYNQHLVDRHCMDFDDLLLHTHHILVAFPDDLAALQEQYRYVIVDEYQDTNHIQNDITLLLAKGHQNLCVVGDFDQTIYSWRGARIENLMAFSQQFNNTTVHKLEINYRSTNDILMAADALIQNNTNRQPKTVRSDRRSHIKPIHMVCYNETEEAGVIANTMMALRSEKGCSWKDFAVFYRTNQQSRVIEEVFVRHNIPHSIVGGTGFYQKMEIKAAIAYLQCLHNPNQPVWVERALTTPPRGIGKTTIDRWVTFATDTQQSLMAAIQDPNCPVQQRFVAPIQSFFNELRSQADVPPSVALETYLENVNFAEYLKKFDNIPERMAAIAELKSLVGASPSLGQFLDDVALFQASDAEGGGPDSVRCMTLHLAKGLEFPVVFIPGFEDRMMPLQHCDSTEEERRLAYVGITRGKDQVYLLSAYTRRVMGEEWYHDPSIFLKEMGAYVETQITTKTQLVAKAMVFKLNDMGIAVSGAPASPSVGTSDALGTAQVPPSAVPIHTFELGDLVRHTKLGVGTVQGVSGSGDSCIYDVAFSVGKKRLMAKFAGLTPHG